MIYCPKCGAELEDNAKFCGACGASIESMIFCPTCGQQTRAAYANCQFCGAPLGDAAALVQTAAEPERKKGSLKKTLLIGGIGLAAIAVAVLLISVLSGLGKKGSNYAAYIKDEDLVYNTLKGKEPVELADDMDANVAYRLSACSYMTEDGKYLIYPDKCSEEGIVTLCVTKTAKPGGKTSKIDSGISPHTLNLRGHVLTYMKAEDSDLYMYDIDKDEKEKIADGVRNYVFSEDGKTICYLDSDDKLYLVKPGKDEEKLASDVTSLVYVPEDFSVVYYEKDDTLYRQEPGGDKEKIADDVYSVLRIYDTGEIYYVTCEEGEEKQILDYITDDAGDNDDAEWIKYMLDGETVSFDSYSLYYFDGSEESLITDSMNYQGSCAASSETPMIIYRAGDGEPAKIKLSEIGNYWDAEDMVKQAVQGSEAWLAVGDTATEVNLEQSAQRFSFNATDTFVYFFDDVTTDGTYTYTGDLYRLPVSKNGAGEPELLTGDVNVYSRRLLEDGRIAYLADYDEEDITGTLYIDDEKIEDDVYDYIFTMKADPDTLLYYTDVDRDDRCGTLNSYNGKKSKQIGEDIYLGNLELLPDGSLLYLKDYSVKHSEGELIRWKNGKEEKIDEDVTYIISVNRQ